MIVASARTERATVVSRVRGLLAHLGGVPESREEEPAGPRLVQAKRDLGEIRRRLERVMSSHPELGVEAGPLLGLAAAYVAGAQVRSASSSDASARFRGASR